LRLPSIANSGLISPRGGSEGDQWYYAMELLEGTTLSAVCDKLQTSVASVTEVDLPKWHSTVTQVCQLARQAEKPFMDHASAHLPVRGLSPPAQAPLSHTYVVHIVDLIRQVAEAAHALHEVGIIHRDIKPGNLMVNAEGTRAVLMDLGLAQLVDEAEGRLTRTRQFVGTLRYASPEQVLAVGRLDARSDVYSLGATLWELLTLRPLYGGDEEMSPVELMRRIEYQEPDRPSKFAHGLSRDLDAVVEKCLEKDASGRYRSARELAEDLNRFLRGEPVLARPVTDAERAWRWCRRNPMVAGLLTALAVVVAVGFLGVLVKWREAEGARENEATQRRDADTAGVPEQAQRNFAAKRSSRRIGFATRRSARSVAALDAQRGLLLSDRACRAAL
jgi:serine/threonine protein kinase